MGEVWLIHGEDTYSAREQVEAVLAGLHTGRGDPSLIEIEGARLAEPELRAAVNVLPMFAEHQVVLVRDLCRRFEGRGKSTRRGEKGSAGKAASGWTTFLADLPRQISPAASVIFWEGAAVPASNPLVRALSEHARVTEHRPKRGDDLAAWLQARADQIGARLTRAAVAELVAFGTSDLFQMSADLEKLSLYAGPGRAIDEEDVRALCLPAEQERIFALVDAVGQRDATNAVRLLRQICREDESVGHRVLPMLVRQFRLLLQARGALDSGSRGSALARHLGVSDWQARKLGQQAGNFSIGQLTRLYQQLLEIDHASKTGRGDLLLALDLLVTQN